MTTRLMTTKLCPLVFSPFIMVRCVVFLSRGCHTRDNFVDPSTTIHVVEIIAINLNDFFRLSDRAFVRGYAKNFQCLLAIAKNREQE